MIKNSNNCAFPADSLTQTDGGLTKREYLAAKAMQGILASVIHEPDNRHYVNGNNLDVMLIAKDAVSMADALLEFLEPTKN